MHQIGKCVHGFGEDEEEKDGPVRVERGFGSW